MNKKAIFRVLLISGAAVLVFPSCDLFKSVPKDETVYDDNPGEIKGGKVYNPETGEEEEVRNIPTELDTVTWKRNPSSDAPPIKSDNEENNNGDTSGTGNNPNLDGGSTNTGGNTSVNTEQNVPVSTFKSSYEVAVMLPFVTNRFSSLDNSIYSKSEWALQYYGGMKMAMDNLRSEGINLNINVLDTEGNESVVATQVASNAALQMADLIIGPYRSVNVRKVAELAKQRRVPVVSPFSAAARISDDNPYLIQVNPSLNVHIQSIMEHALKDNRAEDVVLVVRDLPEERARISLFQEAFRRISPGDSLQLRRMIIDEDNVEKMPMRDYITQNGNTVFIVPSWSSEVFVHTFLRQAEIARRPYDRVRVYGMPQWMNYADADYSYYEKLDVHISSNFFKNSDKDGARKFRQNFYDRYGKRPEEAAYLGYSTMLYFGRQIHKGGTQFQQALGENPASVLHTEYRFTPVFEPKPGNDATTPIERYENQYVHILKFSAYQWGKTEN